MNRMFRDLEVGQTFDFLDDHNTVRNSFYLRCTKTSTRGYRDENGGQHRVGTINCEVFHVA